MSLALEVTNETINNVLNENDVVVLDLWAPWCGPCRMLGPIIDQIANEYEGRALVAKVNIDENHETAMRYGVRSIPTVLFIKNGEVVDKKVGVAPVNAYEAILDGIIS